MKRKEGVRQNTVNKYTNHLKSLLIKIERDPYIDQTIFCRNAHITSNFISLAIKLGYVKKLSWNTTDNTLKLQPLVHINTISSNDGKMMAEESLRYTKERREKAAKHASTVALDDFTDDQMKAKLKERGWAGELSRQTPVTTMITEKLIF